MARRAVELGVTLIGTAHMYGWGADEELLAEALPPYADGLAWLLGRSPVILPIPGTARTGHLEENAAAARLRLTSARRDRLDRAAGRA